jgi:hypothetical protein
VTQALDRGYVVKALVSHEHQRFMGAIPASEILGAGETKFFRLVFLVVVAVVLTKGVQDSSTAPFCDGGLSRTYNATLS